jgi:hypothetical protein
MIWPTQPQYADFVPKFMRLAFASGDSVALGRLDAYGVWSNAGMGLDDAVRYLLANPDTPNLYFRASAHDGSGNYGRGNCVRAHALFIDIDYGCDGHKRKSAFKTLEDAMGYALTMPLRPSVAWHTGHGLQCAYLLKEPCKLDAGGGTAQDLLLYGAAAEGLKNMAMADSAFTPEHAYRVPLTVNSKAHDHEGLPDVRGLLVWCEDRRYGLEEIAGAVKGYGISDLLKDDAPALPQEPGHDLRDYEALPQDLRDEIEDTGAERSDRLFGIVGRMVRMGYGDAAIASAVGYGADFAEKFGRRSGGLGAEVARCAAKVREGRYVYGGRAKSPVRVYNVPVPVALDECAPLGPGFEAMLGRYQDATGAKLLPRVYDACRFHEQLFGTRTSGVIESPCGAGKSVWALCRIACGAGSGTRHVYVTETVEALHRAADVLEKLLGAAGTVGRVHGFNAACCKALCGQDRSWRECRRNDSKSACASCQASVQCAYFTRGGQERRQVLCLTHAGFVRAMEDGSGLLRGADVIVDEGLSPFDGWGATHAELRRMTAWLGAGEHMLGLLFPGTGLAAASALAQYGIAGDADTYARRNFVFMNEAETAAAALRLDALRNELRTRPLVAGFGSHSDDPEQARDTLASLLNFFRCSVRNDACCAYTETKADGRWSVQCKRSGFDLAGGGDWRSLWMLNASASLAPFPYPSNMPVYGCPDLKGNSGLVTVHALRANPTKAKQDLTVKLGQVPMAYAEHMRRHRHVLVCADKDSERVEAITAQVRGLCGDQAEVTVLGRGRIKGVNIAGDCTLALLQGLATFTGVNDCALHAALQYRRTFSDAHVYNEHGQPLWDSDGMRVPAMRDYYALRSLDEIYQAIWRTAVRNDRQVEAVVVVPDSNWMVALYRTVMPEYVIGGAYRGKAGAETFTRPDGARETRKWDWVFDDGLNGCGVILMQPGQEIAKTALAQALGYKGEDAWEKNKSKIMGLLGDFFEDGRSNRWLRRKA